jgi:hypothetical protein
MDLGVEYNKRWYIIEIKLVHSYDSPEEIKEEGLRQTAMYRDKTDGAAPAYLLIFDRRPKAKQKSWDERLTWTNEGAITVVGC